MRTTKISAELFQHNEKYVPFGSSTCSKKPRYQPEEPGVIVRGKGCRVWDADGNEYIDFRNGLGPVTLGYGFPEVNEAIREQLEKGIVFGHPSPLEGEVAETICEIIPCAEQARFLKTGGEAISAAIKIARAATGRDMVIQIGYNGWLSSVGNGSRALPGQKSAAIPAGVPKAMADLFTVCGWNDLAKVEQSFQANPTGYAALVIACDYKDIDKAPAFLAALRELCDKYGALLIFDEIVMGFRIALAGSQERFNVTPDLAVFAKGIANGMPLSVYTGKKKYMDVLSQAVVSSTYGGEALSLAAAKTVIDIYRKRDVVGYLWKTGELMWSSLNGIFKRHGVGLELQGAWPCPSFVELEGSEGLLAKFMRAAYGSGVSLYNVSYVNFSHGEKDIAEALERLESCVKTLK